MHRIRVHLCRQNANFAVEFGVQRMLAQELLGASVSKRFKRNFDVAGEME
jgi:hypothetical protein